MGVILEDGFYDDNKDYKKIETVNENIIKKSVCCSSCHNLFPKKIIVKEDNEKNCYHCVFWLLYQKVWDNTLNKKEINLLKKYIDLCFEEHDFYNCKRAYNGCILCE